MDELTDSFKMLQAGAKEILKIPEHPSKLVREINIQLEAQKDDPFHLAKFVMVNP